MHFLDCRFDISIHDCNTFYEDSLDFINEDISKIYLMDDHGHFSIHDDIMAWKRIPY